MLLKTDQNNVVKKSVMENFHDKKLKFLKWKEAHLIKWNERFAVVFDKLALLNQSPEKKADISKSVVDDIEVGTLYWLQIVLSAVIATFGLLQNSVAVVIGAMLIAPLFVPLQGLAFAITEGKGKLFTRSLVLLIISSLFGVGIAYLIALGVPLKKETSEILARVSPNIFDLFIAGFSAVIALLALVYKRLSQSVAGVAMAAALMPPLCVIGIQFGFGQIDKAWGALLLYGTNIVAIVLVGVFIFLLYGFHPHKERSYGVITQTVSLLFIALMLSVPLMASIKVEKENADLVGLTEQALSNAASVSFVNGNVSDYMIIGKDETGVDLSVDLRIPEDVELFQEDLDSFRSSLEKDMEMDVRVDVNILRTASLNKPEDELEKIRMQIGAEVESYFEEVWNNKAVLVRSEVAYTDDHWNIRVLYSLLGVGDLDQIAKDNLDDVIGELTNEEFGLVYVPINPEYEDFYEEQESDRFEANWKIFFEENLPTEWLVVGSNFRKIKLGSGNVYRVDLTLGVSSSLDSRVGRSSVENTLAELVEKFEAEYDYVDKVSVKYEFVFREEGGEL